MNILIIEDEVLAANKLERMVLRFNQSFQILEKLRSVEESVEWLESAGDLDLVFLDIHLLDGTCFDILKKVQIKCPVIFTTAYEDFVFDSFKLHSIDYLIKPISYKRLHESLTKLEGLMPLKKTEALPDYEQMLQAIKSAKKEYKNRFLVKFGSKLLPIGVDRIGYFIRQDRVSFLVTKEGKRYAISTTMDELEDSLDPILFFRISRQIILHVQSIQQVHKYFKGRLKVDLNVNSDEEIMVSSRRAGEFQNWLDG